MLKDYHDQLKEEEFVKGLDGQSRASYENTVKKHKENV